MITHDDPTIAAPTKKNGNTMNSIENGVSDFISLRHVTKSFETMSGDIVTALRDVSLQIPKGAFVTLLGPSGCGKSTLLRLIGGLIEKTSGDVLLGGKAVEKPTNQVGMVFQSPVLLPWRTVLENATLAADLGKLSRAEARETASRYIRLVGLEGFERKYPGELSGGMQQRVAICRALVHNPSVLLMDEPFAALDAMTRDHLQVELQSLWMAGDKTVVFVTHSISEAVFLADYMVVLAARPGRVVEVIKVDLPRPRTLDMVNSAEFGGYVSHVRGYFEAEERAA
nr:ABC transporter ATP-binding protein [Nitratireductor indicus]